MGRWQNMRSWFNWYMQLVLLFLSFFFLLSCAVSSTQKMHSNTNENNKANVTLTGEVKRGVTINF